VIALAYLRGPSIGDVIPAEVHDHRLDGPQHLPANALKAAPAAGIEHYGRSLRQGGAGAQEPVRTGAAWRRAYRRRPPHVIE
jgi:hypothetical protein